jgi:hypothetical protein
MFLHIPESSCIFVRIAESSGSLSIFFSTPSCSTFVLCPIPVFGYCGRVPWFTIKIT